MKEAKFYNALNNIYSAEYGVLKKLKAKFGSWEKTFRNDSRVNDFDYEASWKELLRNNVKLILFADNEYPKLLRESGSPPHGLYIRGSADWTRPAISIVGTRKSTKQGEDIARTWGCEFSKKEILVVSGLALGIDSAAHCGVIDAGGKTIAVLGCGLKTIYPPSNKNLSEKILKLGGAIISEYPFGYPSLPQNFVERNRIVASLSLGTLVIEAPEKSGALITAGIALDENREVLVVPGPVGHPNFIGSNKLIKDGARLVCTPQDVFECLGFEHEESGTKRIANLSNDEEKLIVGILQKIGKPLMIDELVEMTNLDSQKISGILTILLIKDIIREERGKYEICYS